MSKPSAKITIVIPNWNGLSFLKNCLPSLTDQTFTDHSTTVVDNGSRDGSCEYISEKYPQVNLIKFPANCGFCAAVNAGIRATTSEFVFLLNNDTELHPDCLRQLMATADRITDAKIFAPKMLYMEDINIINGAGDLFSIYGLASQRGKGEKDLGQYNRPEYIFGACAGAALYRRELFDIIGLFDQDFFAYFEDVDLSFRAQLCGYRCWYVPEAVVYHVDGGTSKKLNNFSNYYTLRNALYVILKNIPGPLLLMLSLSLSLGQLRAVFFGLKNRCLKTVMAAYRDSLNNFHILWPKRRLIQKNKIVSTRYVYKLLSKKYPFSIKTSLKSWLR